MMTAEEEVGKMSNGVVVLGSANADLVVEVERRPGAGETLLGSDLRVHPGGKGANQAAAAARAGAETTFIGRVGDDDYGRLLRDALADAGVDVSALGIGDGPTGTALILLTPDGENSIVVSPGENREVCTAIVDAAAEAWRDASVLVASMEIPEETVAYALERAGRTGVRVVLNAAPARRLEHSILRWCDPLIVNEHEAGIVLGNESLAPEDLARGLREAGTRSVIITLGVAGALVADSDGLRSIPAHVVRAVDTTGAGDAFVGATACELANGASLTDAVRFATAMSAIAVQHAGAQSSYRDRAEVEELLTWD
ncbi:ribokinase [Microbacterium sp. W4I4]|uniref:ribokinase n=1 Tax=Microbacterium sp. W4I4 TaxID=3042295 RepID=UPI00277F6D7F|nr:ribokinase [Microbacterium sp. W4I4]MDQ0614052.1 ribokinase [Microbacterium sp. W4I4]